MWALVEAHFADGGDAALPGVHRRPRAADPRPEFLEGKDHQLLAEVVRRRPRARALRRARRPRPRHRRAPPRRARHRGGRAAPDRARALEQLGGVRRGHDPEGVPQGRARARTPTSRSPRVLAEHGLRQRAPAAGRAAPRRHRPRRRSAPTWWRPPRAGTSPGRRCATCSRRGCRPRRAAATSRPTSARLGATIAGLHVAMAAAWGTTPGDPAAWAAEMEEHLDELVARRRRRGSTASTSTSRSSAPGSAPRRRSATAVARSACTATSTSPR